MYDFPASPTNGQTVTFDSTTWQYNGVYWAMQSGNVGAKGDTGATGATGPQGIQGVPGPPGGIGEAPNDAYVYLRKGSTSTWVNTGTINGAVSFGGHVTPIGNGLLNLGGPSNRWATVYTSDLSLKNEVGDWTIVEGEEDLFITNNKTGKRFKFALIEVE